MPILKTPILLTKLAAYTALKQQLYRTQELIAEGKPNAAHAQLILSREIVAQLLAAEAK